MNQILMTNNNENNNEKKNEKKSFLNNSNQIKEKVVKEKKVKQAFQPSPYQNSGETKTNSIARFFAIAIIILGIVISAGGTYSMAENIKANSEKVEPTVSAQRTGNSINLTVSSEVGIKSIIYSWNESEETIITGKNQKEVTQTIKIISGDNKLNLTVVDSADNSTKYVKNYIQEESDTIQPQILISSEGPKVKITVTDDTELDYIVFKYGDNPEAKIEADATDPTKIEAYIEDVQETEALLAVQAIDKSQNVATQEMKIKGTTKPKIDVQKDSQDPSYIIIKVTDNDALRMVSFYIGEQLYQTDPNASYNQKEFEYRIQVNKGENKVTVHAYNISDQVSEFEGTYTY